MRLPGLSQLEARCRRRAAAAAAPPRRPPPALLRRRDSEGRPLAVGAFGRVDALAADRTDATPLPSGGSRVSESESVSVGRQLAAATACQCRQPESPGTAFKFNLRLVGID
jgi:hypothetical protein